MAMLPYQLPHPAQGGDGGYLTKPGDSILPSPGSSSKGSTDNGGGGAHRNISAVSSEELDQGLLVGDSLLDQASDGDGSGRADGERRAFTALEQDPQCVGGGVHVRPRGHDNPAAPEDTYAYSSVHDGIRNSRTRPEQNAIARTGQNIPRDMVAGVGQQVPDPVYYQEQLRVSRSAALQLLTVKPAGSEKTTPRKQGRKRKATTSRLPTRHDQNAITRTGQHIPRDMVAGVGQQFKLSSSAALQVLRVKPVSQQQLQVSSPAALQLLTVKPTGSDKTTPRKQGRKQKANIVPRDLAVEWQPIRLPQDLHSLPDQSYHLREDLDVIVAVRAYLDGKAPKLVPYKPEMVENKFAELEKHGMFLVDKTPQPDGDGAGHGTGMHARSERWSCQVTNLFHEWMPKEQGWVSKQYYIGEYIHKKDACEATDRLNLKMSLCGYPRKQMFNFPPENYLAEMATTDVQFIRQPSLYCEHVLTLKRQFDKQAVEQAEHPYRGVYRHKTSSTWWSPYLFVSRLLIHSKKGRWFVGGRSNSPTEVALAYDKLLIREGLFVNPGARHHILNFPLCVYKNKIMDFVQEQVPELSKLKPEALDRLTRALSGTGLSSSTAGQQER